MIIKLRAITLLDKGARIVSYISQIIINCWSAYYQNTLIAKAKSWANVPQTNVLKCKIGYEGKSEDKDIEMPDISHVISKRVMSWHCNACPYIFNQDLHELTLEYKVITRTLQEHFKAVLRLWELKIGGNAMLWHHPFANGKGLVDEPNLIVLVAWIYLVDWIDLLFSIFFCDFKIQYDVRAWFALCTSVIHHIY